MLKFIKKDDEDFYPLDISDMFDEDDGLEDEFADEFDELFEEVNYLYYDDDSEDITGEERRKRVLH
jgi:hypothetical protein